MPLQLSSEAGVRCSVRMAGEANVAVAWRAEERGVAEGWGFPLDLR